jgi:hypothetical protein
VVQLFNREELPVPKSCDDPAFHQKHSGSLEIHCFEYLYYS